MAVEMPAAAIAGLAAVNIGFRLAGPVFRQRFTIPPRAERLVAGAAAVMLLSLAATSALTQGRSIVGEHGAGWARPAGVAVAGVLAVRRAPFPVVVIAGALVTALLRLAGIP
jgi:branched-subunit amino acid transport protein